jgi:ubiquinone/menaquinone biosynthesis C-methylase UbiE
MFLASFPPRTLNSSGKQMNAKQIERFWTKQARVHGTAPTASWSDVRVMELEQREILRYLDDGDKVLDVGCGNGCTTIKIAEQKRLWMRGVDCVPAMLQQAQRNLMRRRSNVKGRLSFSAGNITNLREKSNQFDKLIAIRVVINLDSWEQQLGALRECARVLKTGGLLLLSDATTQGWRNLNRLRTEWGLPEIPMPSFNLYLDQEKVVEAISDRLLLVEIVNFSSTYFIGTRIVKPLLIRALGSEIDPADPNMEWNRWCAQLPPWGDYGTQKLFVFRKRKR